MKKERNVAERINDKQIDTNIETKNETIYVQQNLNLLKQFEKVPTSIEEFSKLFEKIYYESWGFPVLLITFDYSVTKKWSVGFRNPATFENPDTDSEELIESFRKMFDFIKEGIIRNINEKQIEDEK